DRGIDSGINLLVARSNLEAAARAAAQLRSSGLGNDRLVYLPMRGSDTPTPAEVAQVAGGGPFRTMSCLAGCERSPRFCSGGWDAAVAWCSSTAARQPLEEPTYAGLAEALAGLGLAYCGATARPVPEVGRHALRLAGEPPGTPPRLLRLFRVVPAA